MLRIKQSCLLVIVFLLIPNVTLADVLLITRTVGTVSVKDASGEKPAAKTAFPLLETQTLVVSADAMAVVLKGGKAKQIIGPKEISTKDFQNQPDPSPQNSSLTKLLSKKSSISNVGATRSGSQFSLQRPLTVGSLIALQKIAWSCNNCGEQSVAVVHMESFETLWSTKATGVVSYDGPDLKPGEYALQINDQYLSFRVADSEEQTLVQESLMAVKESSASLSLIDRVSIEVALWNQADMPTEALYHLDEHLRNDPKNIDLKQLIENYQTQYISP